MLNFIIKTLLPELVLDCRSVLPFLPSGFIYQQDGAPAHMAKLAQDWIATNCSEFTAKDEWPANSPDLNPLDYHVCMGSYAWTLQVISTQAGEHRSAQESSAVDMGPAATGRNQQSHIELPEKTSGLCESWWWTLRTYTKMNYLSDFVFVITVNVSWQWKLQVAVD